MGYEKLFANKPFLAWILKECTDEFKTFSYKDILSSLSDDVIEVGRVYVDQDVADSGRIVAENTEDLSKNEGLVRYDIKFSPTTPDEKSSVGIIVNIEGQALGTGLTYKIPSRMMSADIQNVKSIDNPIILNRTEFDITYPHVNAPKEQQEREKKAEIFEGLIRSFFMGSVLIKNDPEVEINGIGLKDYYKNQILKVTNPRDPLYVGSYSSMQEELEKQYGHRDSCACYQQTVETCALVIGLDITENEIWNNLTSSEKNQIAEFLSDWGHGATVPQNWRLFNMLDLAFLAKHGYKINENIMLEHAAAIVDYYVGDGWYRDGQSFDYYSVWAFNVYGPIWCKWYGYEHAPLLAAKIEEANRELMKTYPLMFDSDGYTVMWGRSGIYRNAATSAFEGNFYLNTPNIDSGLARFIVSGSLLQFLTRDDFLEKLDEG